MSRKKKTGRQTIKLTSPESNKVYYTQKNNKNTKERVQLIKYAPDLRKRVAFKED